MRGTEPGRDHFDEGSEPTSGPASEPPSSTRREASAPKALSKRTLLRLDNEVASLELEISRVLGVLAAKSAMADAVDRSRRSLERLRQRIDRARKKLSLHRRALLSVPSGQHELLEPNLEHAGQQLTALDRCDTSWAQALGALDVLHGLAGRGTRRVSVGEADPQAAMTLLSASNPTAAIADLPASVLDLLGPKQAPAEIAAEPGESPGLRIERRVARFLASTAGEEP